jgi:hypothetical protein
MWDREITAQCSWCGRRFSPEGTAVDAIKDITRNAGLRLGQSACTELPEEAWDDPRLQAECPHCRRALRFNPFIVDNREVW